ncbi:uncharacterized protein B0H18DRAFT_389373 [Fomitopsis serialis]|uniref:uncharacterized protein n=1 Tax=Fomitopsis serialis TaxID=139415 RepID=UPI0020086F2E|nr:uncharacterized protein B0H18DRAFT_389373 [Neoantrodia serialis]KAH9925162.1 hypothetical protein B0H18DRAFT_389373 [Neoantrodia serialis]
MPSDHQDSELVLSNEIVRALGNELTRLRACNADLKASIGTLEASKDEADRRNCTVVSRNDELEGENERLQQELDDTRRSLQGRIKEEDSEPCILSAGSVRFVQ